MKISDNNTRASQREVRQDATTTVRVTDGDPECQAFCLRGMLGVVVRSRCRISGTL